jgi:hypothetical protein
VVWRTRTRLLAAAAAGLAIALLLAVWRNDISASESVHFSVNIPQSTADQVPGGMGATGREGRILVDLSRMGTPKRLLQPALLNLSSHWVKNVGDKPLRLRFALVEASPPAYGPVTIGWSSTEKTFDEVTHDLGRVLGPGDSVSLDWEFHLPARAYAGPSDETSPSIAWTGVLEARDADSGEVLTRLPITIGRLLTGATGGGTCCGP